jgi:hypothetical protein
MEEVHTTAGTTSQIHHEHLATNYMRPHQSQTFVRLYVPESWKDSLSIVGDKRKYMYYIRQNYLKTHKWIRSLHYSVSTLVLLIVKMKRYSCVSAAYLEHGCVDGGTALCILTLGIQRREIISFSIRSLFTDDEKISSNKMGPTMALEPIWG